MRTECRGLLCGLKKKQWEKGRNYVRRVMKSTEIKARFPLCFGRHTHNDRMKIRAPRNIHPGSRHCKNMFFWYVTCVVWETFTDVSNEHTASTSRAEYGGSGFLQKPLYFDLNTQCLIAEDGILQRLIRPHNIKAVQFLIQILGKVTRKGCKQVGIISYQKLPNGEQSRVYPKLINYYTNAQWRVFYYTAKTLMFQHPKPLLAGIISKLAYWSLQHNSTQILL